MTPTETEAIYRKVGKRYTPTTLSKLGAWGWHDLMILAAFRYCCGRMTYISGACADWIVDMWPQFPERAKALIRRELDEEFRRDDEARARKEQFKPLGWDCDRAAWEKVRALWAETPPARPCHPGVQETIHRARHLVAEMEAVGQAIVRLEGRALPEDTGRDLQDAASALDQAIERLKPKDTK